MKPLFLIFLPLILTGCISQDFKTYERYLASKKLPPVTVSEFPHCQGYGCPAHTVITLNDQSWRELGRYFTPPSTSAAQERRRIEQAVGLFERKIGPMTGTDVDIGDTFKKTGKGQLDCVDESTNTTIYLDLMKQKGWLKFHELEQPQIRLPFTGGGYWVHQTAVIREVKTGDLYAVDSWFDDNGHPAYVVPFESWRTGWKPESWKKQKN
jgi:hypothetical protein